MTPVPGCARLNAASPGGMPACARKSTTTKSGCLTDGCASPDSSPIGSSIAVTPQPRSTVSSSLSWLPTTIAFSATRPVPFSTRQHSRSHERPLVANVLVRGVRDPRQGRQVSADFRAVHTVDEEADEVHDPDFRADRATAGLVVDLRVEDRN